MKSKTNSGLPENIIYLIFWILMFAFTILLSTGGNRIDWVRVAHELIRIVPFFLIFLIHNYILYHFLVRKKHTVYFALTALVVIVFSLLGTFKYNLIELFHLPQPPNQIPRIDLMWTLNTFFYNFIFSVLGVGFNDAIKITIGWLQDRREYEQLQKEILHNQLSLLQHQISPHFFMNTLNNIHALIDYDKEIAKNSVVKLSQLMRVLLYENESYTLQKEIDFINGYIELMKIRVNHNVEIRYEYPEDVPVISFPPLLLISFVENSFKHGIKAIGKSYIHIFFTMEDGFLIVNILNSKAIIVQEPIADKKIGINNSLKRLDLIYGDKYKCEIHNTENNYEVNLKIPL